MTTTNSPKATATVKRPNGNIETVDVSAAWAKLLWQGQDQLLSMLRAATAKAGRGEVLSVECESKTYEQTEQSRAVDAICDHQDKMERVMRSQG
jgi:hypothetical protein